MSGTRETSRSVIVRCPHCGAKNRVDRQRSLTAAPICARCHTLLEVPALQDAPMLVRETDFEERVVRSPLPVLLEFWSPYCLYCQQFEPVMQRITREASDRLRVARINIDENKVVQARYAVTGTPTLLVLDQGRELERIVGATTEDQLRYRLYRFLNPI